MKRCSKCGAVKPRSEFGERRASPDGLQYVCRGCHQESRREHYKANRESECVAGRKRYRAHRESILERQREYREANREIIRERKREYYKANREIIRERKREYYKANRERELERNRRWRKDNPGGDAANVARRYARKKKLTPPNANMRIIKNFYRLAKVLEGIYGEKYHVDHIIPLARGGLHHHTNLRVCLAVDNMRKGARI